MDIQPLQQPTTDEGSQEPNYQIPNEPKSFTPGDPTGQPPGKNSHHSNDDNALVRQVRRRSSQ
jgi:hypothetical protein